MSQLLGTDYVFIIIVVLSTLMSIKRGFLKELFSVICLGSAVFLAFRYCEAIARFVNSTFHTNSVTDTFAMTATFLFVYIVSTKLTNKIIRRAAAKTGFRGINKILGIAFGFLRGVMVIIAAVALTLFSPFVNGDAWLKTPITLPVKPYSDLLLQYIPDKVENSVKGEIQESAKSPIVQQTKKLINAVFGTKLEIIEDTKTTSQPAAVGQPTDPNIETQPQVINGEPAPAATPDAAGNTNTPLMRDAKPAPRPLSDREILFEKLKQRLQQPATN